MSRAFVDNDQGYDASPRVYVNNMNTLTPTVNLPERRPDNAAGRLQPLATVTTNNSSSSNLLGAGGQHNTTADRQRSLGRGSLAAAGGGAATGIRRSISPTTINAAGAVTITTAHGDAVHANLQDVYSRIMRRLQRQMNYAELSRVSLAEQYGVDVDLELEDEEERQKMEKQREEGEREEAAAAAAAVTAVAALRVGGGDGGEYDGRRQEPAPLPRRPSPAFHSSSSDADTTGDGDKGDEEEGSRPASQGVAHPFSSRTHGSVAFATDAAAADGATTTTAAASAANTRGRPAKERMDGGRFSGAAHTHAPGPTGTSRLLQFKQQQLPTAANTADTAASMFADTAAAAQAKGRSDAEVEKEMAEQPCPRPLRLVVQHVLDTLQKKMTLAGSGSLRDCIIFSFECRALLDRLLKEIPLYTQYTAHSDTAPHGGHHHLHGNHNNGGGGGNAQQIVAGVYQQLRKRPVLLPRGGYVEDPVTGAIRAELVGERNNSSFMTPAFGTGSGGQAMATFSSAAPATAQLPLIGSRSRSLGGQGRTMSYAAPGVASTAATSPPPPAPLLSGLTSLPEMALPASYGKSARLAANTARQHGGHDVNISGGSAVPSPTTPGLDSNPYGTRSRSAAGSHRRSQHRHHSVLRDHLASPFDNPSASLAADSYMEWGDMLQPCGLSEAVPAAHRATQLVSVGTITDDNGVTTVPRSDFAALQQRVAELETQLADAQHHRGALADQLCEEAQYTDQKKRIVQYLRETLVRECNMLRTQLHQATAHNNNSGGNGNGNGGGGGGLFMSKSGAGPRSPSSAANLANTGGLNGSTRSWARPHKLSNEAALSSSTTMGMSALMAQQQQKASLDRPSDSGSLGSVYGGNNFSVGGRGNSNNNGGGGRNTPQPRLGGNNNNAGGRNSPGFGGTGGLHGPRNEAVQAEVDAVHSLIDLALLAVEEEAVLPPHTPQLVRDGRGDADVIRSRFRKNAKQQLDELRVDFEERQQALKKSLVQQTAEHNYIMAEQQSEVTRLRALTDTTRVRAILQESVSEIRAELHRVKMQVGEQLHFFKATLHSTGQGLVHRAMLVDSTMNDNVTLNSTLTAMQELVETSATLLLPMLTREYECGYHPWPLKLRNSRDPLSHIVQLRFGQAEVVRLREPLNDLSRLYVAIHQYVMRHTVLPESARPTTGRALEDLCAALALNPISPTDVVFAARRCHDVEGQLRKKLAKLQARLLWNAYLQRTYSERSMAALAEAGIDPRVTTLPVSHRIAVLTQQRGDFLQTRLKLQRERADNAKELYRLWREREIDITEGYPVPQTQRNRLALLSSNAAVNPAELGAAAAAGGGELGGGLGKPMTAQLSTLLQRGSVDVNNNDNNTDNNQSLTV